MIRWSNQLVCDVEAFLLATNMPPTRFGLDTVNDGKLVPKLREGKTITLETADRIREFINQYMRDNPPATEAAE